MRIALFKWRGIKKTSFIESIPIRSESRLRKKRSLPRYKRSGLLTSRRRPAQKKNESSRNWRRRNIRKNLLKNRFQYLLLRNRSGSFDDNLWRGDQTCQFYLVLCILLVKISISVPYSTTNLLQTFLMDKFLPTLPRPFFRESFDSLEKGPFTLKNTQTISRPSGEFDRTLHSPVVIRCQYEWHPIFSFPDCVERFPAIQTGTSTDKLHDRTCRR